MTMTRVWMRTVPAACTRRRLLNRWGTSPWGRGGIALLTGAALVGAASVGAALFAGSALYHVYYDRENLPDVGPFTRFEFPTIGHVYDTNGQPLIEFAREYRNITKYADIPPVVRDAILAAEDKHFFSHNGVDYSSIPRVIGKVRLRAWWTWLTTGERRDKARGRAIFPQGGSTITQQLVRGVFLQHQTSQENSDQLRSTGLVPRALSVVVGARNVNMVLRKREEIRLSLWIEQQMREQFGSKPRAKEEIFARYSSFVYMGNGQYGFARAADYYFGRSLSTFTADDADKAALLAGIPKSPREYTPRANATGPILHRRNQILTLMAAQGFISRDQMTGAQQRPLPNIVRHARQPLQSSAVVEHVLGELNAAHAPLSVDDLLQGEIQVYSTVDARVQRIVSDALEHGLERYERRHPSARTLVQGSIVVLKNRDGSILAETGGRQVYNGRATSYRDFNRVRQALRQPGSAMKPIVYLAAFRHGDFTLETLVPDEPISVPSGRTGAQKWISNYDGRFKGLIPIRQALAESRNAAAMWITEQIGIDAVLRTSRSLGVQTPLQRYATTALGASEVNLLELATAYRTIASGVFAQPYVIRQIVRESGEVVAGNEYHGVPTPMADDGLALIQEGLRGVVRIPTGTAHALDSRRFPIAVMGKTGTTNDFRDALFVGATYGAGGVTVAVRIGFDDNRSLGPKETGARVALPVFEEVMLRLYRDQIAGPAPSFPPQMEQHITRYLQGDAPAPVVDSATFVATTGPSRGHPLPAESKWLREHGFGLEPVPTGNPPCSVSSGAVCRGM
ncbi:MAG TPA: transglycosylase domain-containing protein [Vicinamibacterales bacterium]|nr:transglycosylase domain-containing protein [Vicinamibacterales bacterium]